MISNNSNFNKNQVELDLRLLKNYYKSIGYYDIKIEGEPVSVKGQFQLMASVEENLERRPGDNTLPAYYATAIPVLQAIPIVCGAKPGIVYANSFANYTPDLRALRSPLIER